MKSLILVSLVLLSVVAGVIIVVSANSSNEHTLTINLIGEVTVFVYTSNNPYPILVMHNETISFNGTATVKVLTGPPYWLEINGTLYKSYSYTFTVNASETIYAKAVPQPINFEIVLLNQGSLKVLYGNNEIVTNKTVTISVPWNDNITLKSSEPFLLNESSLWQGDIVNYLEFTPGYEIGVSNFNVTAVYVSFVNNVTELKHVYTNNPEGFVHLMFNGSGNLMLTTNESIDIMVPTKQPNTYIVASKVNASTGFIANSSTCYVAEEEAEVTIYSPMPFYVNGTKAENLTESVTVFGQSEHYKYTLYDSGDMTLIITFPTNKTSTTTTITTTSTSTSTTSTSTTTTTSTNTTTSTPTTTSTSTSTSTTTTSSTTSTTTSTNTTVTPATTSSSTTSTIKITPTPTTSKSANYTTYIAIAVVVIVVLLVAFFLLRRK